MTATVSGHRLPRTFRPVRYDLHLDADPARPTFTGTLSLAVDVAESAHEVRLHAKKLAIASARAEQGGAWQELAVAVDEAREEATLRAPAPLKPGPARLEISYSGPVAQGMAGLYLSKDGSEACLATQCEATDARAIVPCFDEPDRKAVFALRVTAPKGLTVLANGAALSRVDEGERTTWTFTPTPPMSSYLLALAVGPFEGTDSVEARGVPFRVWALAGKHRLGAHGRDLAVQMLPWYEDYFGQPYAFGKYDQVAVPSFAFGAMENAGLVVFRPSLILLDPATAAWDERKDVALVVAHEFAHMWFGDLVTMAWWDDLWLNEAFAEWMAHRCVADLAPELDVWARFRARAASAMATDALASTHPIYTPVETPAQAQELFDAITYGKGSATMRMLEQYLGEDAFRAGLRTHMAKHRLGNATGADLWGALEKASSQDVPAIMKDWVQQAGHPTVAARWDGAARKLHLAQHRTRSSPLSPRTEALWRVPLVITYEDDAGVHTTRHLLAKREEAVTLTVQGTLRWLWPNAGDVGFYRCALDASLLPLTLGHADRLRPEERIALLRDLWHQVRCGERGSDQFMAAFASLLDAEAHYTVVQQAVGLLRGTERILEMQASPAVQLLRDWVAARLRDGYRALGPGKPGEDPMARERRAALLRALAAIAHEPGAVSDARRIAQQEREGTMPDATLAGAAVAAEAINGDASTLRTHLATYIQRRAEHAAPQDVERYLYVLPAFRDPALVQQVLAALASGTTVAPQAVGPLLRAMLTEPHSQAAAWAHLRANWPALRETVGEAWVGILVEASGELPPAWAAQVRAFWDANLAGAAGQSYARAQERLAETAEAYPRIAAGIEAWLTARAPQAVPQPT